MSRGVAAVLILACAACASKTAAPFEAGADRHHFDIVMRESGPDTFTCAVKVTDLVARRTIEAPAVAARAGAPGAGATDDAASGARLEVRLTVDAPGHLATCAASVLKDGRLVASDHATLEVR